MCKQKLFGEKCGFQYPDWFGPNYFDKMANVTYMTLSENEEYRNCFKSSQKTFEASSDYLRSCDCPLECTNVRFSYSSSSFSNDQATLNTGYLKLLIFYSEMKETVISESPKSQPQDLMASFGGTLGLFLGFSILTLAELFDLFIEILIHVFRGCKSKTAQNLSRANCLAIFVFIKLPSFLDRIKRRLGLKNEEREGESTLEINRIQPANQQDNE
jgi:hypothetical protein